MSKSKARPFTPGPWSIEDDDEGPANGPGGEVVADVLMEHDFACIEEKDRPAADAECRGNRRLVKAAPDLLARLDVSTRGLAAMARDFAELPRAIRPPDENLAGLRALVRENRAVLRAARGKR